MWRILQGGVFIALLLLVIDLPQKLGAQTQNAIELLLAAINTGVASPIPACATTPCPVVIGDTGAIVNSNSTDVKLHVCGLQVTKHITTATDTQLVAAVTGQTIYVCDYELSFAGADNLFLEQSTTGTCASPTQIGQTWYAITGNANNKPAGNFVFRGLKTTVLSAQLCVNTSAAVNADITVYYDQY